MGDGVFAMKFDMNATWGETVAMLRRNADILGIVAAVFFFLPSLVLSIVAPTTELEQAAGNPDMLADVMAGYASKFWWIMLLYALVTIVGTLAVFALFGRDTKPTVGEAIGVGFKGFVPYLLSALLVGLVIVLVAALIGGIAAASGIALLGILAFVVLFAVFIIVSIRVLLAGPIIAIEGVTNPITALKGSWDMVKGHTRRVFAFVLLIVIAVIVVSLVIGLIIDFTAAMTGPQVGLWVKGVLSSLLGAVTTVVMLAAYTAIYRQLSGSVRRDEVEVFE